MKGANRSVLSALLVLVAASGACGMGGSNGTSSSSDGGASTGTCTARVLIAFYTDAACTAQAGMRTYDTSRDCFSWTAMGSNARQGK
jgi:hypothetical protein